jgi:dCMP deaminase
MDVHEVYSLREKFTIIALTGRTGSGCSEVAQKLSMGFEENGEIFPNPEIFDLNHNSYRKYKIIYNYSSINFKKFKVINYKDILTAFILKYSYREFCNFLKSKNLKVEFENSKLTTIPDFSREVEKLAVLKYKFHKLHLKVKDLINDSKKDDDQLERIYYLFESKEFREICNEINAILMSSSLIKRNKAFQIIANNLRKFGHPYKENELMSNHIFTIAEVINDYIKSIKKANEDKNTEIVIDTLRNPFEIMFFKQRYSAYYTFAVSRSQPKRDLELKRRYKYTNFADVQILLEEEYSGAKNSEYYKQNVSSCIQNADIHIAFKSLKEVERENQNRLKNMKSASPYFSWGMQLLKFIALIDHPGIITPSPEERCMQFAYTAKSNSGCISRQVGAAICDEYYSLKAIGWNNTPEGHVPCSLRNIEDLLYEGIDFFAFTPYERENEEFRRAIAKNFKSQIQQNADELRGRNVSYCFKTIINSFSDGKNQVHTRSLHAEENAFLQISKYGGTGIKDGKLFTTASPCELCSKKAFQLGIKVIYYIDPYPGISFEHILKAGRREINPKIRLFYGVIGGAYHSLYEPLMPYKDELSVILKHDIKDLATRYKDENQELKLKIRTLTKEINELKSNEQ